MRAEIVFLDSVDSTNNYAMLAAEEGLAGDGYTVVARHQAAGRGQRGRAWYAGEGAKSLLMSTALHPRLPLANQWTFSMAVSVAIRGAVAAVCPGLDLRIKWPNDLIAADKKVGGILIENSVRGTDWTWAVVGVGINVSQVELPVDLPQATSLHIVSGHSPRVEELARAVADSLLSINVETAALSYHRWLYRRDMLQSFQLSDGDIFRARVVGVANGGELIVADEHGVAHLFRHGQIEWLWPEPLASQHK